MNSEKKTLSKLKLNKLSESELEKREMKVLKGGCGCRGDCSDGGGGTSVGSSAVYTYCGY